MRACAHWPGEFRKVARQRFSELGVIDRESRSSRHYNQVRVVKLLTLVSKGLADQSLEPIPVDGPSGLLLRDRQTEPGTAFFAGHCQYGKPAVGGTPRTVEYTLVICRR